MRIARRLLPGPGPGVAVSVFRRSQFSELRPRLDDSDTKRLPNTSIGLYN